MKFYFFVRKNFCLNLPNYWRLSYLDEYTAIAQVTAVNEALKTNLIAPNLYSIERTLYAIFASGDFTSNNPDAIGKLTYLTKEKLIIASSNLLSFLHEKQLYSDNLEHISRLLVENMLLAADVANKKYHPYININVLLYVLSCRTTDLAFKNMLFYKFIQNFKLISSVDLVKFLAFSANLLEKEPSAIGNLLSSYFRSF